MSATTQTDASAATQVNSLPDPRLKFKWSTHKHKDRQVSHLQRILLFHANAMTTEPAVAASLCGAWERLQNRLDRMLGNPEPKAQDPEKLPRGKKSKPAPVPAPDDPSATA